MSIRILSFWNFNHPDRNAPKAFFEEAEVFRRDELPLLRWLLDRRV
jgi:hypothetical protein